MPGGNQRRHARTDGRRAPTRQRGSQRILSPFSGSSKPATAVLTNPRALCSGPELNAACGPHGPQCLRGRIAHRRFYRASSPSPGAAAPCASRRPAPAVPSRSRPGAPSPHAGRPASRPAPAGGCRGRADGGTSGRQRHSRQQAMELDTAPGGGLWISSVDQPSVTGTWRGHGRRQPIPADRILDGGGGRPAGERQRRAGLLAIDRAGPGSSGRWSRAGIGRHGIGGPGIARVGEWHGRRSGHGARWWA